MSVSRYAVYGQKIVQDAAVAASLKGDPTDIDTADGFLAVIDRPGNGDAPFDFQRGRRREPYPAATGREHQRRG